MTPIDSRTRDNPEAAMVHAKSPYIRNYIDSDHMPMNQDGMHPPSAAFFDHPHDWQRYANWLSHLPGAVETPFMRITRERAAAGQEPWPRGEPQEGWDGISDGALPGFDSEAHRSFMRSLG